MAKIKGKNFHPVLKCRTTKFSDIYKKEIDVTLLVRSDGKVLQKFSYREDWGTMNYGSYSVRGQLRPETSVEAYALRMRECGWSTERVEV